MNASPSPARARVDASPAEEPAPVGSDEAALVARARTDADAFAALYRRHCPAIARYVRRRVGDEHAAADLVAETFLAALEGLARYRWRGLPFRAWLYRLASTRVNRWARRAGRAVALVEEPSTGERVPGGLAADLAAERARAALLGLPARTQTALALHYLEGLSVEEIAAVQGCRPGTVKARLSRGRARMRRRLAPPREELGR